MEPDGALDGLLPEEIDWEGQELLKQVHLSQERVDTLRAGIGTVSRHVSRIKDNQDLIEKQKVLLQGQQEAMNDVKKLTTRVQNDNEALRMEVAQMKKLREQAAEQRAAATAVEVRHRKQLEGQAELVAKVRHDLMALSAENAELRRAAAQHSRLRDSYQRLQQEKADCDRRARDELMALRKDLVQLQEDSRTEAAAASERHKQQLKEQRFKLLRTQQQQQQMEAERTTAQKELDELKQQLADVSEASRVKDTEISRHKARETELQQLMAHQQELHRQQPAVVETEKLRATEEEVRLLQKKLEQQEAAGQMTRIEVSKKELWMEEEVRGAKMKAEELEAEVARLSDHVKDFGERNDSLAAKLSMAEASLLAKDELLRTRTERLRTLTTVRTSSPTGSPPGSPPPRELQLLSELETLRGQYESLDATSQMRLEKAERDRALLERKVEELTARIEDL